MAPIQHKAMTQDQSNMLQETHDTCILIKERMDNSIKNQEALKATQIDQQKQIDDLNKWRWGNAGATFLHLVATFLK